MDIVLNFRNLAQQKITVPDASTPGGPLNAVQFNNPDGTFDGSANLTFEDQVTGLSLADNVLTVYYGSGAAFGVADSAIDFTGSVVSGRTLTNDLLWQFASTGTLTFKQGDAFTTGVFVSGLDSAILLAGVAFADLPAPGNIGNRATVTDAATTLTLGIGTAVAGGGVNKVPVFDDGAQWVYG